MGLTGCRDQADDLAQRTALRGLERSGHYQAGTSPRAWLFTIARRLWLNDLKAEAVRRGSGRVPVDETDLQDLGPPPETNIFVGEVFRAIGKLPASQRETVMLVYVEGLRYRDAAAVLDVPIGTVMSRLAAARKRISETLGEERD